MRAIIYLLSVFAALAFAATPKNAILLSKVKSLTLRGDQLTTARRTKAIPQLKCVRGSGKGLYDVDVMRCKNSGSEYDAEDISWTCQASLPPEFKLGSTEVICEGYASPDDPYVLKGSCGVEYALLLTKLGEERYGKSGWRPQSSDDSPGMLFTGLFWLVFGGIVLLLLYKLFQGANAANRIPRAPFGRGFGGGFPGGGDDPPPPYSRRPPKTYSQPSSRSQQGWRPGFWSGAAAGAAAGYAMGGRNRAQQAPQAGPSNWFNRGGNSNPVPRSPSSTSNERYESTGFGGTRRR